MESLTIAQHVDAAKWLEAGQQPHLPTRSIEVTVEHPLSQDGMDEVIRACRGALKSYALLERLGGRPCICPAFKPAEPGCLPCAARKLLGEMDHLVSTPVGHRRRASA